MNHSRMTSMTSIATGTGDEHRSVPVETLNLEYPLSFNLN